MTHQEPPVNRWAAVDKLLARLRAEGIEIEHALPGSVEHYDEGGDLIGVQLPSQDGIGGGMVKRADEYAVISAGVVHITEADLIERKELIDAGIDPDEFRRWKAERDDDPPETET